MSIEELLEQLEEYHNRRRSTDHRPEWLRQFIRQTAELFEPLQFAGRVGFDCQPGEKGWIVTMYLGTTEIIGGPRDGQIDHVSFRIDLHRLMNQFQTLERFEWYSVSNENDDRFQDATRSLLSVTGYVAEGQFLQLEFLSAPPVFVGPGLKIRPSDQPGGNQ